MKTIPGNRNHAKVFVDDPSKVESSAIQMIMKMLYFPDLAGHIAVMPDTHLGVGAVIGGVVATNETVVPNIVGVDIGCGMSAFNTGIKLTEDINVREFWRGWGGYVKREVPMGFQSHRDRQEIPVDLADELYNLPEEEVELFEKKGQFQLGTLGGGNHFMEAQVDESGNIWFMVHSGSRNMGLQLANKYNNIAMLLNKKMFSEVPKDLWFLPMDSNEGKRYFQAMHFATSYALENRWRMLEQLVRAFQKQLGRNVFELEIVRREGLNIHHNFAAIENHNGKQMIVHRKGATIARSNVTGIIPGSMGTSSYIVNGTDNEDSYTSCSHGAGRRMSRKAAHESITEKMFNDSIQQTFTPASVNYIDEAPDAYKDIDEVMRNQSELVSIVHKLRPIYTLKSDDKVE